VPLACLPSFHILTYPTLCLPQEVSVLRSSASFRVFTCTSLYGLQEVSAPFSIAFLCPQLSIALCSPGSEYSSPARSISVSSLFRRSALFRKWVPVAGSLSTLCSHLSIALYSPVGEYPWLARFLSASLSLPVPPFTFSSL
jgi:hypothetical protein